MRKFVFLFLILCFSTPAFAMSQSEKLEKITGIKVSDPIVKTESRKNGREFCLEYMGKEHYWDESKSQCLPLKSPYAPDIIFVQITNPYSFVNLL